MPGFSRQALSVIHHQTNFFSGAIIHIQPQSVGSFLLDMISRRACWMNHPLIMRTQVIWLKVIKWGDAHVLLWMRLCRNHVDFIIEFLLIAKSMKGWLFVVPLCTSPFPNLTLKKNQRTISWRHSATMSHTVFPGYRKITPEPRHLFLQLGMCVIADKPNIQKLCFDAKGAQYFVNSFEVDNFWFKVLNHDESDFKLRDL